MKTMTIDGNTAASYVAYAFTELAVIYPITPSSPMAELADEWSAKGNTNLFGFTPKVAQLQSEGGAAGALHGGLSCGALTTTYTCSQGLLLMLPNMYKIAGELLPTVIHVSARALATHALSIFGDHQDVMACRQTGFAMLASASVQEAADLSLVAHITTLKTSVPFLHFFDGFRTSHELSKIEVLEYEEMKKLVDIQDIENFRSRALNPDHPIQRGTAQNGDIYFQNREAANRRYLALPHAVQAVMDNVAVLTGRKYRLFDYFGAFDAKHVAVIIGSGGCAMEETVEKMNADGEKVGVVKVRLYRPFDGKAFCDVLPKTCKSIAVLDRTKEAGALGEPLYLDVCAALIENGRKNIRVVGGRYGLGSKEFTPTMCYAVFKNLERKQPKNHFTVGICDDVTHTSLDISKHYDVTPTDQVACKFYGLGSDGTVGANKNSIKIIGNKTNLFVQGYFCYDSKKSGGTTVSHLRYSKRPIRSSYLIDRADFIACHNPSYLTRYDMLSDLKNGGIFLLNCPWKDGEIEQRLPVAVKRQIAEKNAKFYVIDATEIANEVGLNGRTSTVMQAAFFRLNESLMPYKKSKEYLLAELAEKFAKKGESIVQMNVTAIERAEHALRRCDYPQSWANTIDGAPLLALPENEYFRKFMHPILSLQGDSLPVSAFRADGSVPTGTSKLEKHGVAYLMPEWIPENCIQCNQCAFVCPHACIRPFLMDENTEKPLDFVTKAAVGLPNAQLRIQVAAHDCMGCGVCANVCPAKEKALVMRPAVELMPKEGANWEFAQSLPRTIPDKFKRNTVKGSQFYPPLFEFSYACSGCGETPYIKVLTQLFGEKTIIANATGCSSIYGGSAPTCPYTVNANGQGPAWANSLFEDNAEFGYGMRLALNAIRAQKKNAPERSVWIVGGDGWAYDIGYGGLDHVLASGENVNILVLDSEVYSNTGGQSSKATPLGAVARFATMGKRWKKKNLGLMAMSYGYVYVAQVSMGADKQQLLNALTEAESYDGPSLIIAYSPCISHGVNMSKSMDEERDAVACGYFPLFRFNPRNKLEGKSPFTLDSKEPTLDFKSFLLGENRFASLKNINPQLADELFERAEKESRERLAFYKKLTEIL
ncbi:MAG: pyruvate:ferredoxin (flavodoxin) oxidoreductase [Clostridia bacterium]|nr:pyruvate:ferredoxin (flavodoxin) oxidoreductase [Clostridia bacterium]